MLRECKSCGKVFNSRGRKVCPDCMMRLEELYSYIHDYLRDHDDDYNVETLAEAMDINPVDVQLLVEMGYIERDLQTYSKKKQGMRQKLADELNHELDKMRKENVTTYGGMIYSRDKDDERQYVYDGQKNMRRR